MKQMNLLSKGSTPKSDSVCKLGHTERLARLEAAQSNTFQEMAECLNVYGMCNVVRPTGFGKTKLFMDYTQKWPDRKFLYVYDVNSVVKDIMQKYKPCNVEFISYSLLSSKASWVATKERIYRTPWHTVIFDESHLLGGENISQFCEVLIRDALKARINILGGTATPVRTDAINVTDTFFGAHTVSEYTMRDAILDGIMLDPLWCLTVHMGQLLSYLRTRVGSNAYQQERIAQLDRAYARRLNVDKVYRDAVLQCYGVVPDTMQFIAFYPTIDSMLEGESQLLIDFQNAFPEHEVVIAKISSDPEHYSDIVTLQEENQSCSGKRILLIMSVNMLNQAYHSDSITGIIMNRATISNIIFTQQLGRCLSVTAPNRAIVFDNVGNAKINPDAFLAGMPQLLEMTHKDYKHSGNRREHREMTLDASLEVLEFLDWYSRLCATCELTSEQLVMARRNWERHGERMGLENFSKLSRMPSWFVEQEVAHRA